jgi:hypothetical protein
MLREALSARRAKTNTEPISIMHRAIVMKCRVVDGANIVMGAAESTGVVALAGYKRAGNRTGHKRFHLLGKVRSLGTLLFLHQHRTEESRDLRKL